MTQQTELEQFRQQLTKNQAWLDVISTRRAKQDQVWYNEIEVELAKARVLNKWLDEIIEKQAKENKK